MKKIFLSLALLTFSSMAMALEPTLSCDLEESALTVNMYVVPGFNPAVEILSGAERLSSGHYDFTYQLEPVEAWILSDGTGANHIAAVADGEGTAVANVFLKLDDGTEVREFGAACTVN